MSDRPGSDVDIENQTTNGEIDESSAHAEPSVRDGKDLIFEQYEWIGDLDADPQDVKEKKQMARAALALWKEEIKHLEERGDRVRLAISTTTNEVYQILAAFIVFAGVMFTSAATSSILQCKHIWGTYFLVVIAYCSAYVISNRKYRKINKWKAKKHFQKKQISDLNGKIETLKKNGYSQLSPERTVKETPTVKKLLLMEKIYRSWALYACLSAFMVMLIHSLSRILCQAQDPKCQVCPVCSKT